MKPMPVLCVLLVLCLLATSASGATKKSVAEIMSVDDRLDYPVTLSLDNASLAEVCGQLAKLGGVKLYVRDSIRDDQVILFCKDRPLRDVMRAIADVWSYEWRLARTNEGEPTAYTLVMSSRTQAKRERLLKELSDLHVRKLRDDLNGQYAIYALMGGDLAKTEEFVNAIVRPEFDFEDPSFDIEKWQVETERATREAYRKVFGIDLPSGGPLSGSVECLGDVASAWLRQTAYGDTRRVSAHQALTMTFASLPTDTVLAILEGRVVEVVVPSRPEFFQAPPQLQAALLEEYGKPARHIMSDEEIDLCLESCTSHESREYNRQQLEEQNEKARQIDADPAESITIQFAMQWLQPEYKRITATIRRGMLLLPYPPTIATSHMHGPLPSEMKPGLHGVLDEEAANKEIRFKPVQPEEMDGRREISLSFSDMLCQLHEQSGYDIVAQLFSANSGGGVFETGVSYGPMGSYLAIHARPDLAIECDNRWLMCRWPDAYLRRLEEPPRQLVRKWMKSESEYGCVTFADLLEIAQLPRWQYNRAVGSNEGLSDVGILRSIEASYMFGDLRRMLAFILALSPEHRDAYLGGQQLKVSRLSPNEQAAFMDAFAGEFASDSDPELKGELLTAFIIGGPYHLHLYDPKEEKRWTEIDEIRYCGAESQEQLLSFIRSEYEEKGIVVEEITPDPAPSTYMFCLETSDPESGTRSWRYAEIELNRIEKPKEEQKPSEENSSSDPVPQTQ